MWSIFRQRGRRKNLCKVLKKVSFSLWDRNSKGSSWNIYCSFNHDYFLHSSFLCSAHSAFHLRFPTIYRCAFHQFIDLIRAFIYQFPSHFKVEFSFVSAAANPPHSLHNLTLGKRTFKPHSRGLVRNSDWISQFPLWSTREHCEVRRTDCSPFANRNRSFGLALTRIFGRDQERGGSCKRVLR